MTDHRNAYYPPSSNLTYQPPTTTRILLWLMHAAGWLLAIIGGISTLFSGFFVLFGIVVTFLGVRGLADLIAWLVIFAVSAGVLTLGLFMTGRLTNRD